MCFTTGLTVRRPKARGGCAAQRARTSVDSAFLGGVIECQDDALNVHLRSREQIVDVPVLAGGPVDVAQDAGPQGAGGPSGVNIRARWKGKPPQPTDLHADRD